MKRKDLEGLGEASNARKKQKQVELFAPENKQPVLIFAYSGLLELADHNLINFFKGKYKRLFGPEALKKFLEI